MNDKILKARKLYLDIETIPAAKSDELKLKDIYESKKRKYELRGATYSKKFRDFILETNVSGSFGQIFCISYAIDDKPAQCLSGNEREILEKFWEIAKDIDLLIGHNVIDFDLKFIYQRSIILQIKPTVEIPTKRYCNFPVFDTLREWQRWSPGLGFDSLDALAKALDIPSSKEDGLDGSLVSKYYYENRHEEIITYCKKDVEVTRKVFKKMNFIK